MGSTITTMNCIFIFIDMDKIYSKLRNKDLIAMVTEEVLYRRLYINYANSKLKLIIDKYGRDIIDNVDIIDYEERVYNIVNEVISITNFEKLTFYGITVNPLSKVVMIKLRQEVEHG